MNATVRGWRLHRRTGSPLERLAAAINPVLRGWHAYFRRFNVGEFLAVFHCLERRLVRWACRKYKGLRRSFRRSQQFIRRIRMKAPTLFAHWQVLYGGSVAR